LAPNDQENEDANRNAGIPAAAGTPVARKTRRAVLRRMNATSEKDSPTQPDPPKTPGTPGNLRPATETPRRSCRKSVRPAIDYDDIVRSAKKVIAEVIEANPEDEEPSTQIGGLEAEQLGETRSVAGILHHAQFDAAI